MKKVLVIVLALASVSAAHAGVFRFFVAPVISTYTGQWPNSVFTDWGTAKGNLNPFANSRTGTIDGLGFEIALCRGLALEVGGFYFNRGAIFTRTLGSTSVAERERYELQGLGFPVFIKIKPLPRYYPYLLAGVEASFVLSHNRISYVKHAGSVFFEEVLEEDLQGATKKFDWGPLAGIGCEFPISKWALLLEARYRVGMVDLIKGIPAVGHAARLRTFTIVIGYKM